MGLQRTMSLELAKPSTCVLDLAIPRVGGVVGFTKLGARLGFAKSSTRMLNFANPGWVGLQKRGWQVAEPTKRRRGGGQICEGGGWLDLPK